MSLPVTQAPKPIGTWLREQEIYYAAEPHNDDVLVPLRSVAVIDHDAAEARVWEEWEENGYQGDIGAMLHAVIELRRTAPQHPDTASLARVWALDDVQRGVYDIITDVGLTTKSAEVLHRHVRSSFDATTSTTALPCLSLDVHGDNELYRSAAQRVHTYLLEAKRLNAMEGTFMVEVFDADKRTSDAPSGINPAIGKARSVDIKDKVHAMARASGCPMVMVCGMVGLRPGATRTSFMAIVAVGFRAGTVADWDDLMRRSAELLTAEELDGKMQVKLVEYLFQDCHGGAAW
ncbi:hypothetical protein LTR85_007287 [Meristemomyces frigidus]|nr:hypothetical protein LTR85_007287 [Meristemomyces frigidus]